jgi:hypothetical protein
MKKQKRGIERDIVVLRKRLLTESNPNKRIIISLMIMTIESDMESNLANKNEK